MGKIDPKSIRRIISALLAAALLCLLTASAPMAAYVPPGNSAADQYTETYPSAEGNQTTGEGRVRTNRPAVPGKVLDRLRKSGPIGLLTAEVALRTAPETHGSRPETPADSRSSAAGDPEGSDPILEVSRQAIGDPGGSFNGILLFLVLVISTLGAITYAVRSR